MAIAAAAASWCFERDQPRTPILHALPRCHPPASKVGCHWAHAASAHVDWQKGNCRIGVSLHSPLARSYASQQDLPCLRNQRCKDTMCSNSNQDCRNKNNRLCQNKCEGPNRRLESLKKIYLIWENHNCLKYNSTHIFSNRKDDISQLVKNSP